MKNQKYLSRFAFSRVFVSSLIRTQQTAEVYGYHNYLIEPLLDELDFGRYEGVPKEAMEADLGEAWQLSPENITLGESLVAFRERVKTFVQRYQADSCILVFGHGAWLRAASSLALYGEISGMNQLTIPPNAVIEVVI